jgi:hypothetical protein
VDENETPATETTAASDGENTDVARREVMARLGKLAALTAPAVVTLMMAPRASAGSPVIVIPDPGGQA